MIKTISKLFRPRMASKPVTLVRGKPLSFVCADETAQYEPQVLDYIDRLEQGSVFFDLGACVGFFSLYAAVCGLKVFAFEIESKNFAALEQNFAANGTKARAFHIGVSDHNGWGDLRVGQDKAGGHHKTLVVKEFAGPSNIVNDKYAIERVRVGKLDDLIRDLPPPDHMKIDIDGSEVVFLRGAQSVLQGVQSLMFELYEDSPYYSSIIDQLQGFGFKMAAKHPINQPWPGCERLFNCEFWK